VDSLQEGAQGPDVRQLQTRLRQHGFSPGAIDGSFGPATEAAVLAFQTSMGLLADGIVGARTAAALGFAATQIPAIPGMPAVTIAIAARMFPGAHVKNISDNLPLVLGALNARALTSVPIVLAALATIRAETSGFVPIDEGISRYNTSPGGAAFDLYDHRSDLGNRGPTDGADFKGRGFIQLTGRSNYETFGPIVGVAALATQPARANEPAVAADLLAAFVKAKEIPLKQALVRDDMADARRLVNGGRHGLDQFTDAYRTGQKLLSQV